VRLTKSVIVASDDVHVGRCELDAVGARDEVRENVGVIGDAQLLEPRRALLAVGERQVPRVVATTHGVREMAAEMRVRQARDSAPDVAQLAFERREVVSGRLRIHVEQCNAPVHGHAAPSGALS
jgi:hypothetical protein